MRLLTRAQSQELDRRSMTEFNLSPESLMEAAGAAVLQKIVDLKRTPSGKILVLIGPGNNGGDGWVIVRLLREKWGVSCTVCCPDEGRTALWQRQKAQAGPVRVLDPEKVIAESWDIIFDCVYGTGLSKAVTTPWAELFTALHRHRAYRIAVDLPSGLPADTGVPCGPVFRADLTVTFGAGKPGLYLMEGPRVAGRVAVAPLSFPPELLRQIARTDFAFGEHAARLLRPRLSSTDNKGTRGHCVLLCGSETYRGAGILTAEAALRTGVGYVHLGGEESLYPDLLRLPEVLYFERDLFFSENYDFQKTSFVLGPGLLDPPFLRRSLEHLRNRGAARVILDAEALNLVASGEIQGPFPESWLMTPHPGELARLLKTTAQEINANRMEAAREGQRKFGATLLLKGFRTVVASSRRATIVLAGNSALAKAGSGDVLSGLLGSLAAQMDQMEEVALLGAYLHGAVATEYVRAGGYPASFLPSDLIDRLGPLLSRLRNGPQSKL